VAWVHGQLVAVLDDRARLVEVRQVELRVDALREQVDRERDQVDVAGPLTVAEQRSLDPVGAGHQPELGGRDRSAAVVVRVDADDDAVARRHVPLEPLDAIGIDVRRERLDRRRQVDDHLLRRRRLPGRHHCLTDPQCELELGAVEALRRVLEDDAVAGELFAERGRADRELDDPRLVEPEDDPALCRRGRVVQMHDRARCTIDRFERALDQLRSCLREHGDRRVSRDQLLLDELPHEVEVGLRCRREPHLDLLDPELDEEVEHPLLARRIHGLHERLVAVAQVGRAPDRRTVDDLVRPGAVG
jgi:hypothetical protein